MESEPEMEIEPTKAPLVRRTTQELSEEEEQMVQQLEAGIRPEEIPEDQDYDKGFASEDEGRGRNAPEEEEGDFNEEEDEGLEEISIYSEDSQARRRDHCEVCYSDVSRRFLQHGVRHLFDLIKCKSCGQRVHHICYGINTPIDQEVDEFDNVRKSFLCDHCKEEQYGEAVSCYICGNQEGCLRLSRDRRWFHPICASSSTTISFRDVSTMNVDLSSFRKRGQKIPAIKKCSICKSKLQTFECINTHIEKSCHLHCALRRAHVKPEKNKWKIFFELYPNQTLPLYNYVDEVAVINNIEDIAVNLKEVIEETGMAKTFGFPKDLRVRKGKNREKRRRRMDSETTKFVTDVFENAKRKVERNFEDDLYETLEEENSTNDVVGGRVIVINTSDMTIEEEEIIQGDDEDEEDVFVDAEGLTPFDTLAQVIMGFYHEIASINTLLEVYSEDKLPKLRSDLRQFPALRRLTFPEVLFFVNVYQKRAQVATNNLASAEDLEKLIKSASVLPFSMVGILRTLNDKYYTTVSTDILLRSNVEQCAPQSAYIPSRKAFDDVTIRRNKKTIQQAKKLERIYLKDPCMGITQQSEELKEYYKELLFLNELYTEIAEYFNPDVKSARTTPTQPPSRLETPSKGYVAATGELPNIPISKLLTLYSQASRLYLSEQFGEVNLLKDFVGRSKDLIGFDVLREAGLIEGDLSEAEREIAEGKRSIGKYVKVIPAAPIPLAAAQIGRPKKPERIVKEIEKDYKTQLARVKEFPTLEEAERALGAAERSGYQRKVEMIEASVKRANEWRDDYEEAVRRNDGRLGNLIERIELVGIFIDEMAKALEYRKVWSLWRSSVVSLQRRFKKKVENFFGSISDMVSFEELEEVINEGEKIIHIDAEDSAFRELKEKYRTVAKVREELNDKELVPDLDQLKQYKKDLKSFNVRIPEMVELQKMITLNETVKQMIDEPIGLKKLEEKELSFLQAADKMDPNLMKGLKAKINKGKELQKNSKALFNKKETYSVNDIAEMEKLIKESNDNKIEVEELQRVKCVVDEFLRLTKLYAVLTSTEAVDSKRLENKDFGPFAGKNMDDIVDMCLAALVKNEKYLDEIKTKESEEVYRGFSYETVEDPKITKFFDRMTIALWKAKAKVFAKDTYQRTSLDIARFIADIPPIDQLSKEDKEAFAKVQQSGKRVRKWKEDTQKFLDSNPKQTLLELGEKAENHEIDLETLKEKTDHIRNQIERLSSELEEDLSMYTDLVEENNGLRKIIRWIDWILDVVEMKKQVEEEHKPLDFATVKFAYEKIDKLGLPKAKGLCKTVAKWNQLAEGLQKEFNNQYQKKKEDQRGNLEGRLFVRNKKKMTLDEAKLMLDKIEGGSTVIVLPEQVKQVKEDTKIFEEWKQRVNRLSQKYTAELKSKDLTAGGELEIDQELGRELAGLKGDMLALPIRDEKSERDLMALDWTQEVITMLQDTTSEGNYDEWKKMLKNGDKLDFERKGHLLKLTQALEQEIYRVDRQKALVKALKKAETSGKEGKISFNTLRTIVEEADNARILLKDEKKVLENQYDLAKRLSEKAKKLVDPYDGEKALEEEFTKLMDSIQSLPVDLSADYKMLESTLKEARKLEAEANRVSSGDTQGEEKIAQRYLLCPIFIEKAAGIARSFEGLQVTAASIKDMKVDLERAGKLVDYAELDGLSKQIEGFEKQNGESEQLAKTKVDIFLKKMDILEKKIFRTGVGASVKLTISELRQLLKDGAKAQRLSPQNPDLERSVNRLEDILKLSEAKADEINAAKNVVELEKCHRTFNEIVDLSHEINDRREYLSLVKIPKPRKMRARSESQERRRRSRERSRERERQRRKSKEEGDRRRKRSPKATPRKTKEDRDKSGKKSVGRDVLIANLKKDGRAGAQFESIARLKTNLRSKHLVVADIKNILDSSRYLDLRFTETFKYAELILAALPEIYESRDAYEAILDRLKKLIKSPYISKSLLDMNFDETYLRHLVKQDLSDLKVIESRLRSETVKELVEKPSAKKSAPVKVRRETMETESNEEEYDDVRIPKKPSVTKDTPTSKKPSAPKHLEDKIKTPTPRKPETPRKPSAHKESPVIIGGKVTPRNLEAFDERGQKNYQPAYDPSRPQKGSDILKHPNVYRPEVSQKKLQEREDQPLPEDSILKIYSGNLVWDDNRTSPRMLLYSCDSIDKSLRIPTLPPSNELKVTKQTDWRNFEDYFTNILRIWQRKSKDIEIISGWVEPEASIYESRFEQIANELLKLSRVGVCEYMESTRLFFLHKQQMRRDWAIQLDLKVRKARNSSRSTLYWIIVHRSYRLKTSTKSLAPEIVKAIASHTIGKESLAKDFDDVWELSSQKSAGKSSLDDFESDFGGVMPEESEKIPFPEASPGVELGKRTSDQIERGENEEIDMEQLVKKIKSNREEDQDEIVAKLQNLETEQIKEIAMNLTFPEREKMMQILRQAEKDTPRMEPYYVEPANRSRPTYSGSGTVKSTPVETYLQANYRAFADLGPSEVVERYSVTITNEGGQAGEIGAETLMMNEELRRMIERLPGVSLSGQFVTLSRETFEQVRDLQRQFGLESGMETEGKKKTPRKIVLNEGEVEIEEESVKGDKKPAREGAVEVELEGHASALGKEDEEEEVQRDEGVQVEGVERPAIIESTTIIQRVVRLVDLEEEQDEGEGEFSPDVQAAGQRGQRGNQ